MADSAKHKELPVETQSWASFLGQNRRLSVVALLCLAGLASIFVILYFFTQNHLKQSVVDAAARYTEAIAEFRTVYTSEVVARLLPEGVNVTHDYEAHPGAIPLPATLSMELGRRLGAGSDSETWRLYSDYPFPWRKDGGPLNNFERDALQALRQVPTEPFYRFELLGGRQVLRYATADLMRPSCVGCHNSHEASPKTDWKVGEVRGVLTVTLPVAAAPTNQIAGVTQAFIVSGVLFVLGAVLLGMVIARQRRDAAIVAGHAERLEQEARIRKRAEASLKRSNDDLLQFAHIASHDLNEPARKVMAFGTLLDEECGQQLGDEGQFYLKKMVNASERMRKLIDGLLAYSRVSRNALEYSEIDLNDVINTIKSDLSQQIAETSGSIEVEQLPTIWAHEIQIHQLFQNLISNGLKFHVEGKTPVINISAEILSGTAAQSNLPLCRISIKDNGIGFDSKYQDSIFHIFERLHGRDEYEGTGIGLAVCRKVAERHGGSISAESIPGEGSTFIVTLPMQKPKHIVDKGGAA